MISFEVKDVEMPDLDLAKVEIWLQEVADAFNKKIGNLNYLFCNDSEILEVNKKFLNHDYFTDIITFDYSRGDRIGGDIYVSLDTVKDNAEELEEDCTTELLRVIVHGLLHLCGVDDKGPGERIIMESHEDAALELWSEIKSPKK